MGPYFLVKIAFFYIEYAANLPLFGRMNIHLWHFQTLVVNMIYTILIFLGALSLLLLAAHYFTKAAEHIGVYFKLPTFVVGVFIVGIGTSLPELISGIISVNKGLSEIIPGNIMGSNISNLLLITGLAVALNGKNIVLRSQYLYIDLHFLLGSVAYFYMIAYDGRIEFKEAFMGGIIFIVYSIYLIKGGTADEAEQGAAVSGRFPIRWALLLALSAVGIYFGADYTVASMSAIATALHIPSSIIALTLLSLGTTLPELTVNIAALRQGKPEMAVGNVLGSCVFNALVIPPVTAAFAPIDVPANLLAFSLPVMAGAGLLFYLLAQDKRISIWEGLLFVCLYLLFMIKIIA